MAVPAIFAIPRQIGQDDSIKRWNNPSHRLQKQRGKFSGINLWDGN